jgi:hypothetical protein
VNFNFGQWRALAADTAEEEGKPKWDRGERVAEVVDQVGQTSTKR